jgi:hypothetical protein
MDRVRIQRTFRKAYWICSCGQEDTTDLNLGTPSVYEHNCSACNKWSNSFKEYNGNLSYTPEEYDKIKEEDVELEKTKRVDNWIYEIKHPFPYVEPTKEELEKEKLGLEERIAVLSAEITLKTPIKEVIK